MMDKLKYNWKFINLFFFEFNLYFILNVHASMQMKNFNPWINYMIIYHIPAFHIAGVYSDLNDFAFDSSGKKYRYAGGRCPVFGKIIIIKNKSNFLKKLKRDKIETTNFLSEIQSGNINFKKNDSSEGIQFPTVENEKKYKLWQSPVQRKTIYGCAKYASQFEHFIIDDDYDNCVLLSSGNCVKQPFIYDLKQKMCYILYPLMQEKKTNDTDWLYRPSTIPSLNHFVFGSYNIKNDWQDYCISRSVKAVEFGKWDDNRGACESLDETDNVKTLNDTSIVDCETYLFENSPSDTFSRSNSFGYNWGNYNNVTKECKIFQDVPNCFILSPNGYALASTAIKNATVYAFPPCINASVGWEITAACEDNVERTYTCKDLVWYSSGNITTKDCKSYVSWENVDNAENPWKETVESYLNENADSPKLLKGVELGYWDGYCYSFGNAFTIAEDTIMTIDDCMQHLKTIKTNTGFFHGNWVNNRQICNLYKTKPNCLIYKRHYFSFSINNINRNSASKLPPCIEESETWVIDAQCDDNIMREYVCFNGVWISFDNGVPVAQCDVEKKKISQEEGKQNKTPEQRKQDNTTKQRKQDNTTKQRKQDNTTKQRKQDNIARQKRQNEERKNEQNLQVKVKINETTKIVEKNISSNKSTKSASKIIFPADIARSVTFGFILMTLL